MAFTSTVCVSKIEFYPVGSDPAATLVVERTTNVQQDGVQIASNVDRTGYDVASPEGKAALTQALSDAGISFITVS